MALFEIPDELVFHITLLLSSVTHKCNTISLF